MGFRRRSSAAIQDWHHARTSDEVRDARLDGDRTGDRLVARPGPGASPATKAETELKTVEQKFAYSIGLDMGRRIKAADAALDPDMIAKGIKDALADKPVLTETQIAEVQKAFNDIMQAKMQAKPDRNMKEGQAFLAANKTKEGVKTTASGLQYKVLKEGKGKSPKATDKFVAHYKGTLIDGTEFDSSYKRGKPLELGSTR